MKMVVSKDSVISYASKRGFTVTSMSLSSQGSVINFSNNFLYLSVNTNDNSFTLDYFSGTFRLTSGNCGPFYEITPVYNQFDKILKKFTKCAQILESSNNN